MMAFDNICGHERAVNMLNLILKSERVGHAYVFEGTHGVGKKTLALDFAAALTNISEEHASDNPDIITVTNELYGIDKKTDIISVETIRNMKRDVYIKPYLAERKVYIIPNADTMNAAAQNSILKVLEDPPAYCVIILLVQNSNLLLQTVLSRSVLIRLHPLSAENVADYLIEKCGADEEGARGAAVMSDGSIGKAVMLLQDADSALFRNELIALLCAFPDGNRVNIYDFAAFLKKNHERLNEAAAIMQSFVGDVFRLKQIGNSAAVENEDKREEMMRVCGKITRRAAFKLMEAASRFERMTASGNSNYRLAAVCTAVEIREVIHGRDYRSEI